MLEVDNRSSNLKRNVKRNNIKQQEFILTIVKRAAFSPARLDDSTNILKDRKMFLFTWKNVEIIQETLKIERQCDYVTHIRIIKKKN